MIRQAATVGMMMRWDVDATKFMNATGIPKDGTIYYASTPQEIDGYHLWKAINNKVIAMKDNNLYSPLWRGYVDGKTIIKAIYPFIGGTADTHKWNLCDPRDLDAAFRLTFSGGWTHSGTGAKGNGTNGYADTHLVPSTDLNNNDTHLAVYSRSAVNGPEVEIGVRVNSGTIWHSSILIHLSWSGQFSSDMYSHQNGRVTVTSVGSATTGFYIANRSDSSTHKVFKDGIQFGSTGGSTTGLLSDLNLPIYLGAFNLNGSADAFSSKELAAISFGKSLTPTESGLLNTIVTDFQTTLGREV